MVLDSARLAKTSTPKNGTNARMPVAFANGNAASETAAKSSAAAAPSGAPRHLPSGRYGATSPSPGSSLRNALTRKTHPSATGHEPPEDQPSSPRTFVSTCSARPAAVAARTT